jgi:hypothetical protein
LCSNSDRAAALDAAAVRAAVGRIRPDAVINELTSLPQRYTPAEMKAAAKRDHKVRVEGNINLRGLPMAPAPAWLDEALTPASPPPNLMRPIASRKDALKALAYACARIIAAPAGSQDNTRHKQCFFIGALIRRGELMI